ncbi:hypothetical protein RI444_07660 [Paenarthrobacter sp. AT5]|uniref:hypothetical protein n=1 Tax=Paenarthrobacter TaxID=1742992 RepID=UPI001A98E676|nr:MULTISPECIES: hypothetical protein [Paenarthrobacter]QSZ54494.1 hypothetical protein AYX19_16910 [Paenarthrobacter ureafaciens]WOC62487.1 hypothetical protein RI444_07660 [Paenarthrobacter sp. AT5]
MNTAKSFGAIGDGITDDTTAIQSWLNAGGYLLEDGVYKITSTLALTATGRKFATSGARLLAGTQDMTMMTVTGDDCAISGHFSGNSLAAAGVYVTGSRAVIENGRYEDIRATAAQDARAINVSTAGGVTVRRNTILRTHNAKAGGFCRAIAVNSTTAATGYTAVTDNIIDGVTGSEGDAIQILFNDGGNVFLDARAVIAQNNIRNASRRFIKVQGSNTLVKDNVIRFDTVTTPELPSNYINAFQSDNVTITGNDIGAGLLSTPIAVTGIAARRAKGITIRDNIIRQDNARDVTSIFLDYVEDGAVTDNLCFGGGTCVAIGNSQNVIVDRTIGFGGLASRRTAFGTSSNTNVIIRSAANMNAERTAPIQTDGTGNKAELNWGMK